MKRLIPPALYRGDTVALIAPASVPDKLIVDRAITRLEGEGFRVKTYRDFYQQWGYLAGEDEVRAEELMQAVADPEVAAIFPVRGGTGLTRLLDVLDYSVFRRHPKILVGFSDITALHAALLSQAGWVTFHGPHPNDGIGTDSGFPDLTARTFWRALLAENYSDHHEQGYQVPLTEDERSRVVTLTGGKAAGRLVGGNLSLVTALLGTPYEFEMIGSILLLEEIGEAPYRVDRMISQLRLAGKLELINGIVLGQFTNCEPADDKPSLSLHEIFNDYFGGLGIPVIGNFPTGHTNENVTLPLGVEVQLDADARKLTILENPVRLTRKAQA